MAEIIKETVTTQEESKKPIVIAPVTRAATGTQTIEYLVYFIFGLIEILLAFRLVLKLLGAGTASGFVEFIYSITAIFVLPFIGIFPTAVSQGLSNPSVLEPASIVGILVYAVVAWGVVALVRIFSGEEQEE
ncbi:MAG TPA: YggT family protein [Patescibacteria group bacterium]